MAVILCYGLIVERALRIALISRDGFGKLMAVGLGDDHRAPGLRRHRRRHRPDPAHGPDHPVPLVRRLLARRQLGRRRAAAAHLRPGPPAHPPPRPGRRRGRGQRDHPGGEAAMNKPIRVVSVFCLAALHGAARQRHLPDVRPRGHPVRRPPQPADHHRDLLPRARCDPRRQGRRRPQRAVRRQVQVPARLPAADEVRPDHRLLLLVRPDRGGALPELRARRRRLATVRHPPRRHAQQQRPQGRQRPADGQRRRAGRRVGGPRGPAGRCAGRRRRARADDRARAGDGLHADLRPEQARLARLRRRGRPQQGAQRRPPRAADQPRDRHHAAARDRRSSSSPPRPRSSRATTTPTRRSPAATASSCRSPRRRSATTTAATAAVAGSR